MSRNFAALSFEKWNEILAINYVLWLAAPNGQAMNSEVLQQCTETDQVIEYQDFSKVP